MSKKKDAKEPKYTAEKLMRKFREYRNYKETHVLKEWRLIRSLYRGDFWEVFKKHLEEYTITPDWNYFEYAIQAYQNSIYSGAFIGTVLARNEEDSETIDGLNAFLQYHWNLWGMKNKFLHIGENGELYNLGAVRMDWEKTYDHPEGILKLHTLTADEVYFDPTVSSYKEGEAIFVERAVNILTLYDNPDFSEAVKDYYTKNKGRLTDKTIPNRIGGESAFVINRGTSTASSPQGTAAGSVSDNVTVSLIECFIRNEYGGIDQIFILDEAEIIYTNEDLPIRRFPIVSYSPQLPDVGPYGRPKLIKILNSVIALNLLDSMEATQPYRLLNRTRFVNVDGRINMRSFVDWGNTPNAVFEVKGDPRDIVYFQDIPVIPDLTNIKNRIENSIFQITGVDPYYKGRATNSVQTTGATQAMQARVTMLTDNSRITMLEEFCEDITRLALEFYFNYAGDKVYKIPKRSATGTNAVVGQHNVNFSELHAQGFKYDYMIAASTLLPMNQANLFDSAKALYEMQGQYQFPKRIVTEQDLVRFSDFPQKDLWLQRLEREEQAEIAENLVADLTNFASIFSKLLSQGLSEEQAAQQAIAILIEEKNAMQQDPSIGKGFV